MFRWQRPPHLPPSPLPLPRCGRGRGRAALTFPPASFLSHATGAEGGDERSDSALASVNNAESTTQITPLPQCGRGPGGEQPSPSPLAPLPLPRCGRGRVRAAHYSPGLSQVGAEVGTDVSYCACRQSASARGVAGASLFPHHLSTLPRTERERSVWIMPPVSALAAGYCIPYPLHRHLPGSHAVGRVCCEMSNLGCRPTDSGTTDEFPLFHPWIMACWCEWWLWCRWRIGCWRLVPALTENLEA